MFKLRVRSIGLLKKLEYCPRTEPNDFIVIRVPHIDIIQKAFLEDHLESRSIEFIYLKQKCRYEFQERPHPLNLLLLLKGINWRAVERQYKLADLSVLRDK